MKEYKGEGVSNVLNNEDRTMANKRQQLTEQNFVVALESIEEKLNYRKKQKGMGTFASIHEILGVLDEEMAEFRDEVHFR